MQMRISLDDGKYTYILDRDGQRALRYGEEWRNLVGDKFVYNMAMKIESMQYKSSKLIKILQELDIEDESKLKEISEAIKDIQKEF